jgi:hypothetical protein
MAQGVGRWKDEMGVGVLRVLCVLLLIFTEGREGRKACIGDVCSCILWPLFAGYIFRIMTE